MNWRSPLELAIRLINWVWAHRPVCEGSGALDAPLRQRVWHSAWLHMLGHRPQVLEGLLREQPPDRRGGRRVRRRQLLRRRSRSPARWRDESAAILEREIARADLRRRREPGAGLRLSPVRARVLPAGRPASAAGRAASSPTPTGSASRRCWSSRARCGEGGEQRARLRRRGRRLRARPRRPRGDARGLLATGAVIFRRADFKQWSGGPARVGPLAARARTRRSCAATVADAAGVRASVPRASRTPATTCCSAAGPGAPSASACSSTAASWASGRSRRTATRTRSACTLRAFGTDVLVDPGTYDYFTHPEWRRYFRSTQAHNTVEVDGLDQSQQLGLFLWGARAQRALPRVPLGRQGRRGLRRARRVPDGCPTPSFTAGPCAWKRPCGRSPCWTRSRPKAGIASPSASTWPSTAWWRRATPTTSRSAWPTRASSCSTWTRVWRSRP